MELNKLLRYRTIWMSIAILWVIFYHIDINIDSLILRDIKKIGYGGIDIFIFASGLGCYYSLNKDFDLKRFMKRRFIRILPTYWCFMIFWLLYKFITEEFSIGMIIGNFFGIQYLTGLQNYFNWYISALWIFYFLAPYAYILVNYIKNWKDFMGIIMILLLFTIAFWNSRVFIIIVTRIPIFIIGMYTAKKAIKENTVINRKILILIILMLVIGIGTLFIAHKFYIGTRFIGMYGLYWYPFILIVPGICFLISLLSNLLEKASVGRIILKPLYLIGNHTFELYLVHVLIFDITRNLISKNLLRNSNGLWLLSLAIVGIGCVILKYLTKLIISVTSAKIIKQNEVKCLEVA